MEIPSQTRAATQVTHNDKKAIKQERGIKRVASIAEDEKKAGQKIQEWLKHNSIGAKCETEADVRIHIDRRRRKKDENVKLWDGKILPSHTNPRSSGLEVMNQGQGKDCRHLAIATLQGGKKEEARTVGTLVNGTD